MDLLRFIRREWLVYGRKINRRLPEGHRCRKLVPSAPRNGKKVLFRKGEKTDGNLEIVFRSLSLTEGTTSYETYLSITNKKRKEKKKPTGNR